MSLRKKIVRGVAHRWPRNKSLLEFCRVYSRRFEAAGYENNGDPNTNGEFRLLREVAPRIRVAFDVGANIGDWTAQLLALAPSIARIHVFEPCSSTHARLVERSFPAAVTLHRAGLSAQAGTAAMYVMGEASVLNALHRRQGLEDGWGVQPAQTVEHIALDTLDNICAQHAIDAVDFVKIDTEGHEVDVLEGAKASLERGILKMIQFEYGGTYIDSRRLIKDVFDLIAPFPYTIFLIAPTGLIAYPRYDQRLENFQYKNFVILHRDVIASVPSAVAAQTQR